MAQSPLRGLGARVAASIVLAGTAAGSALAVGIADPTGTWQIQDDTTRVRIETYGPQVQNICGYPVWLKTSVDANGLPRLDANNPDPAKRGRLVLGHQSILGMKPNADGKYEGKIYNVENGRTYDITAAVVPTNPAQLNIHACVMVVLCENLTWNLVTDVLPGQLTGPTDGTDGPRADSELAPATAPTAGKRTSSPPTPKR